MGLQRKNSVPDVDSYREDDADENPDLSAETGDPEPDEQDVDSGLTEEDEDEETARSSSIPKRGWGAAKKTVAESSGDFANEFKVTDQESLIKFLEDEPFASVQEHWVDEITKGKRSFYCIAFGVKKNCPLCKVGHSPKAKVFFNIAEVTGDEPIVQALVAGPGLTKVIEKAHEGKGGPIDRHYWRVSGTRAGAKNNGPITYNLVPVKARDLSEDYELDADEVAASLKGLELYQPEIIKYPTAKYLQDIVDEHLQDD